MPSNYQAITEYNEDQLGKDTSSRKTQVSMYSDPTHFVYEILQNADDYGATEILFKLSEGEIVIEHNAEPFKEEHVRAITYFGKSTSREDLVKTGRFGIGFKSVFAFTASPIIISDSEHFQIYGLYRVREYPYPDGFSRSRTRIILPFDHESEQPDFVEELISKKEAYRQISECLTELDINTLLFTRNICEIRWEIGDQSECYSREDDEVDSNTRLTTIKDGKHKNKHLVFSKIPTWKNEEHKPVEIAFAVDEQHRLSPIQGEFLHVLFPTMERTGLRFILNGPYRTNPARETISLADAFNRHLMKVTCELMKELLPKLRDRKFLTLQFLSILPNKEDALLDFYAPLRDIVVDEFKNKELTPTKRGDHAPASELYRVDRELSDLIGDVDLALLLGKDRSLPLKVDEISQRRDAKGRFVQTQLIDNFLNTLQIPDWNMTQLIGVLLAQPEMIVDWLGKKPVEWHQALYALLYDFLRLRQTGTSWYSSDSNLKNRLSNLPIVPCSDDVHRAGSKCFFPSDDVGRDERFPRVLKGVYSSGRDNDQKSKAQSFLEAINVRSVNEDVEIEAILEQRYVKGTIELRKPHHKRDLERFIALVEREPDKAILFKDYHIFELDKGGSGTWWLPRKAFLDTPYCSTGLGVYHAILDKDSEIRRLPISPKYEKFGIDLEKLVKFAKAIGVQTKLNTVKQRIPSGHPEYSCLVADAPGARVTSTSKNEDYNIPKFDTFLFLPSVFMEKGHFDKALAALPLSAAKLIWQTMCSQPHNCLEARFRKNSSYPDRVGASSLVHILKEGLWVPQKDGDAISFVCPRDASREHLPEKDGFPWPKGYPHDAGEDWLKAIEFGKIADKQKEENVQQNQNAKGFGFNSADEANTMAEIASVWREQGKSPEESLKKLHAQERRKELLIIELSDAGEKIYKILPKSTKTTGNTIDQRTHLKERYTTDDNKMQCQMCSKEMPFKKRNSDEDYFEAVEALGKGYFFKEHEAQYLALCPECAAEYKEYVKKDPKAREIFHDALKHSDSPQIHLESHGRTIRIWFQDKHWQDLKTVLYYYENVYNPDESD